MIYMAMQYSRIKVKIIGLFIGLKNYKYDKND
jgi:hypothetical protein